VTNCTFSLQSFS